MIRFILVSALAGLCVALVAWGADAAAAGADPVGSDAAEPVPPEKAARPAGPPEPQARLTYRARVAGDASRAPLGPFVFAEYSNGLRAIVREMRGAPVATVDIWVSTGAANEDDTVEGISHFFEHMFFKGTARYGRGEMDKVIRRLGGRNNASTGIETTHYYATVPSENVETALDVVSDGIQHSVFDPAEIERERKVVKEEIRRKEDTPSSKVWVLLQEALAPGLPYARPVLGTPESLDRIDRHAFVNYLASHYVPRNMVVVVTGDVRPSETFDAIAERFAGAADIAPPAPPEFDPPPLDSVRVVEETKDSRQSYFMIGYPTLGRRAHEDQATLDVAAAILAHGRSSRLHRALVEERGLLVSIEASEYALRNGGVFYIAGEGPPERSDEARAAIVAETVRLASALPSEDETARAKSLIASEWTLQNEATAAVCGTLGRYELFFGADEALRYKDEVGAVTPADVQRVLQRIATPDRYLLAIIRPAPKQGTP